MLESQMPFFNAAARFNFMRGFYKHWEIWGEIDESNDESKKKKRKKQTRQI